MASLYITALNSGSCKKEYFKIFLAKCVAFVTTAEHKRRSGENSEGISDESTPEIPQQATVSVIAMNELSR